MPPAGRGDDRAFKDTSRTNRYFKRMLSLAQETELAATTGDGRSLFASTITQRHSASIGVGAAVTIATHAAVGLTLLAFTNTHQPHIPRPFLSTPRLISVVYLPSAPIELPRLELTTLPAPKAVVTSEPAPLPLLAPV